MPLAAGTRVGRYEIRSLLGEGGMGQVYLARDEKLTRDVAIKVLPRALSQDTDRLRRFEQEAQATGALNHPNILAVYDVGTHEAAPYIVSELLEGETLRGRIAGTALPQRKAIDYALQIAHGLAAAHEKGIVHRDLKPENLFLTKDGRIKILDFGLAKLIGPGDGSTSQTDVPTRRVHTDPGIVMGTVGYMSPEQLRGRPADHRSDIFSFGAILYEMLSGKQAFRRDSTADTMSAILREDPPDLSTTNNSVSPAFERVVNHCLEKNPEERFHSARDLAFAIEAVSSPSGQTNQQSLLAAQARPKNRERLVWISIATTLLLTTILALLIPLRRTQPAAQPFRFSLPLPDRATLYTDVETHNLSLAPDGRRIAFIATIDGKRMLWMRSFDELSAQPILGTEGAYSPFWSPDSRYVAFFADRKLKKLEASNSSLQTLCNLSGEIDTVGTWSRDGIILFNDQFNDTQPGNVTSPDKSSSAIYRVADSGGTPALLLKPNDLEPTWVHFLPDGRHFLFYGRGKPEANGIYVTSVDSPNPELVFKGGYSRVEYAPPGYLLYVREGTLLAQPFDEKSLRITGEPSTVVSRLPYFDKTGWSEFSVSQTGSLVYATNSWTSRLVLFDRTGREVGQVGTTGESLIGTSGEYNSLKLSPDGQKVALAINDIRIGSADIWIHDLARNTRTRSVFGPADDADVVWSPDGLRFAFFSCCEGPSTLYVKDVNETGKGQPLLSSGFRSPWDWSADGRFIIYSENAPTTNRDLWVLPLFGEQKPYPFLQTEFNETYAQFSPDGRFVAYVSNESGNDEVYVALFDNPREKWRISTAGGSQPRWRRDGKELFYVGPDNNLMAAPIRLGQNIDSGTPLKLFQVDLTVYDVMPDGQRFLISTTKGTQVLPFIVTLNWTSDLKK
jgi:eukaryotic-like serine/threonine-protein kinase